jgi:EAL domain-containing protein (putative c-di-GMP-specific phosphodiesterase class I)
MRDAVLERLSLEKYLRNSIEKNELELYFQPIVSLAEKKVVGAEALLRWHHPELGMVPPDKFIPVAEDTGQILAIGDWVFRQAVQQLNSWEQAGFDHQFYVTVNVSARQFHHADFVANILSIFKINDVYPGNITIEITESVVMSDIDDAVEKMNQLKAHGISFAIDDFGTGHSSLAYLKRLPIDVLKIDRSFVQDVVDDCDNRAIVDSILSMASHLGLKIVVEGIETEAQFEFFNDRGAECFQGYLFSQPVSAEEFQRAFIP